MSNPLISEKALTTNPEARRLHETGLKAELMGDYNEAHESFEAAQQIIAGLPQTIDTAVQSARIGRDAGFTYVRAAIANNDSSILELAQGAIKTSLEATAPLASGAAFIGNAQPEANSRIFHREFLAEHGATVSLLGRIATVREVMLGVDTRGNSEAAREARNGEQQPYSLAHDLLVMGNNGYYRVSNAMVAARQERINGRLPQVARWLGRAASGLAWTALRDPSNLKSAVRTSGNRARHLRSYRAAVNSVTTYP